MLTISADLSSLSQVQREALSAFILDRPAAPALNLSGDIKINHLSESLPSSGIERAVAAQLAGRDLSPEEAFAPAEQTLENGGLTKDDAHNIVYGKSEFAAPRPDASTSLDKAGLPWDERIHSSSKNFTADGSWRKKRGVTDGVVLEVEAQLRKLMGIPEPAPAEKIVTVPASQYVPPPPPPAGPALVPTPADMDARQAYIKLVGSASKAMQEQKLSKEEMQVILDKYGVPTLPLLMTARPDLIPTVAMELEAVLVTR